MSQSIRINPLLTDSLISVYVFLCVCLSVYVFVHEYSKNNGAIHSKLEHILVYENSSDEFDIRYCRIKVKVKV